VFTGTRFGLRDELDALPKPVVAQVVVDGRIRLYRTQICPLTATVARFLEELTLSRSAGVLALVDHAASGFERRCAGTEPKLADHDVAAFSVDGDTIHPVDRLKNNPVKDLPRRRVPHLVVAEVEQDEVVPIPRTDLLPIECVIAHLVSLAQWRDGCANIVDMTERVTITLNAGIADVKLNRPEKLNALDNEMFLGLARAGEELKTMPGVRVVVLSGEGASFCAGLDFGSMQALANRGTESADDGGSDDELNAGDMPEGRITHLGQQVAWVWQEVPVPVIAAVHGHALGGGIQIMLGADIRIVHPDTKLSVREVFWGLVPDMTGTFVLSKLVRPDVAKELTFTARIFLGTEAKELGIATRLSDNPYDDAMAMAAEIAGRSPGAVRGAKDLFNRISSDGAAAQFAAERAIIGSQIGQPNQVEAVMSGLENRPAVYADLD
jgi:enoyl-CoA hydratase/carnithine racemase